MITYPDYLKQLLACLENIKVTNREGEDFTGEEGMLKWCTLTKELQLRNNTMYFLGNGASAMMASHMAADASKNGGFRALAFNDAALMTAVSNDICYEESFSMPLKRFANPGDILVTISSSGNSPNILSAIKTARELDMQVITISGLKENNQSRTLGDLNLYIPANTYGLTEASHQVILHCWLDIFMEKEGYNDL